MRTFMDDFEQTQELLIGSKDWTNGGEFEFARFIFVWVGKAVILEAVRKEGDYGNIHPWY